ncbi:MAG: type 1 glutamine amidotransferase [Pseudobacter sp.]|uniref:type 1 glutamine amidotransferase n=1 Tax=Pseudobacter sp. TaxID=2045420 RepID=UPI003F7EAE93
MHIHFIQHVAFESPGYILEWAQGKGFSTSFTRLYESVEFPPVENTDWLVVMGGPMSVHDETEYKWLASEKAYIRSAIDAGKKVLGICLGSQLIADVLGARIYKNDQKEIGWWLLETIDVQHPLTKDFPEDFPVFHWHGDTFELPAGATHLFKSKACKNQGYLAGTNVLGLQFHMEVDERLVAQMMQHGKSELVEAPFIQDEATIFLNTLSIALFTRVLLGQLLDRFEAL